MAEDYMAEVKSLQSLIDGSFPAILSKLHSSSLAIPANCDFQIFNDYDEFKRPVDEISRTSQCVLDKIAGRKMMRFAGDINGYDAYDWLVNVNDEILEGIDDFVDEFKDSEKLAENDNKIAKKTKVSFHIPTIVKPQEEYNILVDNANKPFEHVWLEKTEDNLQFIHPLEKLSVIDFVDKNLGEIKPVKPLPLEETPFKLVEEVNDLKDLAAQLQSVEEFAVDLEHNQYRSFQGLTCLMQISTRTEDYIVDTFKLWDHIGPYLREIFKDPKKKKVLHGADRDIIWLQRDFGIYVCNLFDTGQASRVLKLERNSLEFLLKHYCGVAANKQYQNADWRIRPLPDVMTRYAREDTHYLLYIYDLMRLDLHTKAKEDEHCDSSLVEVYKRSYDVCTQLYEKEVLTGDSYLHLYGVRTGDLNVVQLSIVAGLYEWRDQIARAHDESTGYVMPNKTLLDIAKKMPINVGQLRRLLYSKHPYIESNIDAVANVIRRSMQNAAAFEPVVQSLKESHPETVFEKNNKAPVEEIDSEAKAASPSSTKFSVDDSKKQSSGFGALPSKRKFGSDNKLLAKEEIKVSKSKPDKVILDVDDDEQSLGTDYTLDSVSETAINGSPSMTQKPKTYDKEIIVLDDDDDDDDDSESEEEEEKSRRSEKQRAFLSLRRGFLSVIAPGIKPGAKKPN